MLKVIPARRGGSPNWEVRYDSRNPPDVFFDTNVWIGLNRSDIQHLKRLESERGFRFRYSITNYVELVSHLEDQPSKSTPEPFVKYRECFRKITEICHGEVLPAPEMELLHLADLIQYLDSAWIPNTEQTTLAVELISNSASLAELRGDVQSSSSIRIPRYVVKPAHYRTLRETDGVSFGKIMTLMSDIQRPIRGSHKDKLKKLNHWFLNLANFFFLVRASGSRINLDQLSEGEREQFIAAFTTGVGRLFHTHCVSIAKKTINDGRKIDTNDLYDAMQLLCLRDENRIFVTGERFFHYYELDPEIQRVIAWEPFKSCS